MKPIGVIITTTNGLEIAGKSDYIGSATVAFDVPTEICPNAMTKLYELGASVHQYPNCWRVQIAKKHIETIKFFDAD